MGAQLILALRMLVFVMFVMFHSGQKLGEKLGGMRLILW